MRKDPYVDFAPLLSDVSVNGITLKVAEAGRGPSILFLHGFPDHWGAWRRLMSHFVGTNHVVAPDLRGYGRSSRPLNTEAYAPAVLIADVLHLVEALDLSDVTIVGHDWGASLAFWTAMKDAERIRRLIILNGVHPYVFQDRIWDDPNQRRASQYISLLRSEQAETRFNSENAHVIAREWLAPALKLGKINRSEFDEYLGLWSERSAWPAMLNWYRASPISVPEPDARAPNTRWTKELDYSIPCPVHVIWGDLDPLFNFELVEDLEPYASELHVTRLSDAGHVPHRDKPVTCAKLIRAAMFG